MAVRWEIIRLTVKQVDGYASIIVTDNGQGMSPDVLHKVRTLGGSYGKSNGAGIGLQLSREVVIEAEGQISIDSILGEGTTIGLKIPVAPTPLWCPTSLDFTVTPENRGLG